MPVELQTTNMCFTKFGCAIFLKMSAYKLTAQDEHWLPEEHTPVFIVLQLIISSPRRKLISTNEEALPGESRRRGLKSGDDFAGFAFRGRPACAAHFGPDCARRFAAQQLPKSAPDFSC